MIAKHMKIISEIRVWVLILKSAWKRTIMSLLESRISDIIAEIIFVHDLWSDGIKRWKKKIKNQSTFVNTKSFTRTLCSSTTWSIKSGTAILQISDYAEVD